MLTKNISWQKKFPGWPSISCLPPPFPGWCEVRTSSSLLPLLFCGRHADGQIWLYVNTESNWKVLQFPLDCNTDLWLCCGSHLIIFIISLLHHPPRKSKLTVVVGCLTACFRLSLGRLELFSDSLWVSLATGQPVQPPAWLSQERSDLSGLKPSCSPWI